jgi:hypothetical protein
MNPLHQSPVPQRNPEFSPAALEQKLRDFLRAAMPKPWPELAAPEFQTKPGKQTTVRRPLFRSRFALAASLLFLLCGHLVLSGMFSDYSPAGRDQGWEPSIGANPNGKQRKALPAPRFDNRQQTPSGTAGDRRPL